MNETENLPSGWALTTLKDVAEWGSGGTPKATESKYYGGDIPWLVIGDLNDGVVTKSQKKITKLGLENSSASMVPVGAILIAMYGSIGKMGIAGIPCTTNQAIAFTKKIQDGIEDRFLFYYLLSQRQNLLDLGKGGAQPNISQTILREVPIPLAPLNEQRRIVAKLDRVLAKVEVCRTRLDTVPITLKRFRQSVLAAACSGRLTADWREKNPDVESAELLIQKIKEVRLESSNTANDRNRIEEFYQHLPSVLEENEEELPASWARCQIGHAGSVCNGSTPSRKRPDFWGGNISWVSSGEVRNNIICETRERITQLGYDNSSVRLLPAGTVLVAMIGEGKTRGQSAIVNIEATINQNSAAVVLNHGMMSSKYLWLWFQNQYQNNREVGSGSGPQALNCQRVRELPLNFPPLEEQREIVRRVQQLFAWSNSIEERYKKARGYFDKVAQATLAKAFRGELVPQDPNDEPASELLERIKASDSAKPATASTRKGRMRKKEERGACAEVLRDSETR